MANNFSSIDFLSKAAFMALITLTTPRGKGKGVKEKANAHQQILQHNKAGKAKAHRQILQQLNKGWCIR